MRLNRQALRETSFWNAAGVKTPRYDAAEMAEKTRNSPIWLHFGAGNIFRGFIAGLQHRLLNEGLSDRGIVAAETFDYEIIDKIFAPHDHLALNVLLNPDATTSCEIIASVAESLKGGVHFQRLREIFRSPGLQLISFTVTEKGYAITGSDGELLPQVKDDIRNGPANSPRHAMAITAALLLERYTSCAKPLALVSMDNCSRNGEKLKQGVLGVAREWCGSGFADSGFIAWLEDESKVSFPWTMIDKITPRPAKAVEDMLAAKGIEGIAPVVTDKNTYIAAFVNAERPQYLVVEDAFPNGRPPLEKAGVFMTDRETVNKVERMKVTACLNPLHTAMSVYGCLLGYTLICEEMKDAEIVALIRRLGYDEGLPVVIDPGILSPRAFLDEVVNERLPNPFMPDDPRRIATDTSQKVGIRFGETIKSYMAEGRGLETLIAVPLSIAGWFRYLLGVNDNGEPMEVSSDPLKAELQAALSGVVWNEPSRYKNQLRGILSNKNIFGLDLTETLLADRIEEMFVKLLHGPGSARKVLKAYLKV